MPYSNERANRLGHVPTVNNVAVQNAFSRWVITTAQTGDKSEIASLCRSLDSLPEGDKSDQVSFSITVDGSDQEVEVTREHPTIKTGYLRVAGSFVDLKNLQAAGCSAFVDPVLLRNAHQESSFDAALPGSGLILAGQSGVDTWRQEVTRFLSDTRFDDESQRTLADAILSMHGRPGQPATSIDLNVCPTCGGKRIEGVALAVTLSGGKCSKCGSALYLGDILRSHEEYSPEGSNITALTRVMNVAERLMTLSFMEHFYESQLAAEVFKQTIFITDGPLALYGTLAPLKRKLQSYHDYLSAWGSKKKLLAPLLVGIEKTGRFVEHAELIADRIPAGNVMLLTTAYINRVTGRPSGNDYGVDEFYGRRFILRTTSGDPLVITVPPKPGVLPYVGPGAEDFESYPLLRTICEVLDQVRTRLFPNAVIPIALAHSAAALPLGVGHSVLRAMAQRGLGLPQVSQQPRHPSVGFSR
ncbi:MAG: hypothetical protein LBK42_11625 [Propionibacteriaceae bacterium]|nr:hypothetical protein [Propionibacteriaceae bacterium]